MTVNFKISATFSSNVKMSTLSRCPFCGGEAEAIHRPSEITKWQHLVQCKDCGSEGSYGASKAEAIKLWNNGSRSY